jgi:hypothetical protein
VDVTVGIGIEMVLAMMGGPPKRALLDRGRAPEGEQELHRPSGLERTVRKVTMIPAGDEEHPHEVEHTA